MVGEDDITVVIPTIPPRNHLLKRALDSVAAQSLEAQAISVAIDTRREGAALTRQRALEAVKTPWVAFLDDDDEFLPHHLEYLMATVKSGQADFAYSWFETSPPGGDPFPAWFRTEPWNPAEPRHTTMTVLVRTELALKVGFEPAEEGAVHGNEDWRFILGCNHHGIIVHLCHNRTWIWHHDSSNTSGLPWRW